MDDAEAASPLVSELKALAERKKAAEAERDTLRRRIADRDVETERVATLAEWCQTVAANLDSVSYDEKRLALTALGVKVRVYKQGSVDLDGNPLPRWEITMRPALPYDHIVYNPARCNTPHRRHPPSSAMAAWSEQRKNQRVYQS